MIEMFTEDNSLEIVRRNIIVIRNSIEEEDSLCKLLLRTSSFVRFLKGDSNYGLSIKTMLRFCELAHVDIVELFYIDPDWDLNDPNELTRHDKTTTRVLAPIGDVDKHNYDRVMYSNILVHKINITMDNQEWWKFVGTQSIRPLKRFDQSANFTVRTIGKLCDTLYITPEALFDYETHKQRTVEGIMHLEDEMRELGEIYG